MGRLGPGVPVQGQRVPMAPTCGFAYQKTLKSINEEMAPGWQALIS
jgi:hypothetical protein